MTSHTSGIGNALARNLHLSSDQTHEREKLVEADRAAYRRKYWQGYAKKVKRVFGTVELEEFQAAKQRADEASRSIWGQIWAESKAYRNGQILASCEMAEQQRALIVELRRIGNNINQLARLGHIHNRKHGQLNQADSTVGGEAMRQLSKLEAAFAKFDDGVTIHVSTTDR